MYRSYSLNNMPQPIQQKEPPPPPVTHPVKKENKLSFGSLKTDDIILIAVIALLIFNECDDKLLILALAYVFLMDYMGGDENLSKNN